MAMKRTVVRRAWEKKDGQEIVAAEIRFPDANRSAKDVDVIEDFVGLNPPLDILEISCGIGRSAIEFAKRGYRVVATETDKRFLDLAEQAAREANVAVEFRLQSAADVTENGHFDFVLAHWYVMGFLARDEIRRHLSAICAALKPGCSFLYMFQGPRMVPSGTGETVAPVRNWTEKDGKFILTERSVQAGIPNEYSIVIDVEAGEIVEYREQKVALGYADVLNYLKSAGFKLVKGYRDFAKTPATSEEFSIFVCQK
jgi:cyclopropane fatty-acyl-phospholipid synthase-like methyltransferase